MLYIKQKPIAILALLAIWTVGAINIAEAKSVAEQDVQAQPIDLVIALDVSGSMSGLIDSTKQRLWDIVNELAQASPRPDLRMAILTFGNPEYGHQTGYVRIDLPFSRDLDAINRTLFSFTTNGGDEYVSRVIHRSVTDLDWSQNPDALKMLFVAGNEGADQDPQITVAIATQLAANNGIVVNTIYCGSETDNLASGWKRFSDLTNGLFASIDQNAAAVANVATPMDEKLVVLNKALNETYVAYGRDGDVHKSNQIEQDRNSEDMSTPSMASRTITKIGKFYDNAKWDLVDAFRSGDAVAEMEAADLPEPMRELNVEQRKDYVVGLSKKREEISAEIQELGRQRDDYIETERARLASDADLGLDAAIVDGLKEIAESKGFTFDAE